MGAAWSGKGEIANYFESLAASFEIAVQPCMSHHPELPSPIAAYFQAFEDDDPAAWVALFTKDAIFHDPILPAPAQGHEQLTGFFTQVSAFSSKLEVVDVEPLHRAPATWVVAWTAQPAIATTGKTARWPCISSFQLDDSGKLSAVFTSWDHVAAIGDVGMKPPTR